MTAGIRLVCQVTNLATRSLDSRLDSSALPDFLLPEMHTKVSKILLHLFLSLRDWFEMLKCTLVLCKLSRY